MVATGQLLLYRTTMRLWCGHFSRAIWQEQKERCEQEGNRCFEEVAKSLLGASPKQIEVLIEMGTISEKEVPDE